MHKLVQNPSLSARPRSKKVSRNRYLLFFIPWHKFTCRRRCGNKRLGLRLFAQWACKGPCGEQKGKALSGATIGSVVANPSLSALNSLQGVDFQPCRLFYTQKVAPKMHQPRFYALLRVFFKLHISHTSYPTFSLCLQYITYLHIQPL